VTISSHDPIALCEHCNGDNDDNDDDDDDDDGSGGGGGGGEIEDSTTATMSKEMLSMGAMATVISAGFASALGMKGTSSKLSTVTKAWKFEKVLSACILLNCMTIGMQSHQEVTHTLDATADFVLSISEHIFTTTFCFEIIARVRSGGWMTYSPGSSEGRSNLFDAVLLFLTDVLITWIMPFISFLTKTDAHGGTLHVLFFLRSFRLARLVRVCREVRYFREAWIIIRGIGGSVRTVWWTIVVILFVTYAFAIAGLALIVEQLITIQSFGMDAVDYQRIDALLAILGGLDKFMFTLVQVLMQDSFHSIIREVMYFLPWAWVFFYAYMAVGCVVLMNLVTAIIVENAMEQSQQDHAQQLRDKMVAERHAVKHLEKLFKAMDSDENNTISWKEFEAASQDPEVMNQWLLLDFRPDDLSELFTFLDDGTGEIATSEFFAGLLRMKGQAQGKDVYRLQTAVDILSENLGSFMAEHGDVVQRLSLRRSVVSAGRGDL